MDDDLTDQSGSVPTYFKPRVRHPPRTAWRPHAGTEYPVPEIRPIM